MDIGTRILVRPNDIQVDYWDDVTSVTAEKRLSALRRLGYTRPWLVVEMDGNRSYRLIEFFKEYAALRVLQPNIAVYCYGVPSSEDPQYYINLLRKTSSLEGVSSSFKRYYVLKLMNNYNLSFDQIRDEVGNHLRGIDLLIDRRISAPIAELAFENNAKTNVKNLCTSQTIFDELKTHLYERAVKPAWDPERLTKKQLDNFTMVCDNFAFLRTSGHLLDTFFVHALMERILNIDNIFIGAMRENIMELIVGNGFFDEREGDYPHSSMQ
ncbi:hypothetical protein [Radiobacillus sp. PE A8.2]|uniref:hypothetical protein n=1 Tax=Radiobacillus sp. PE A8.2 TaxID=3380349 RepID=UPI00388FB3FB